MTTTPRSTSLRRPRWAATSAVVALVLAVGGCGDAVESGGTTTSTSATSSSTGTSSPTTSATTGSTTSSDVVALAEAFAATLDDDQLASLNQEYTFENAASWSNLPANLGGGGGAGGGMPGGGAPADGDAPTGTAPTGDVPSGGMTGGPGGGGGGAAGITRVGLQTDSLTDEQWDALEDLLRAATGSGQDEGFDEILQHLDADDYLSENGGGDAYGRGQFFVAFLGEPSDSGTWELQLGGHHLAVANTYVDGALAGATPSFRGIEPFETVTVDGTTVEPEQQEATAFSTLLGSLDDDQLATAELDGSYNDLLLGPGNDWAFPETSEGLAGSELTDDQRALLLAAIDTYVDDVDDEDAATILATYESQLDDTYVSWAGTTSMTEVGDYVRIDGPQVWIEFSQQNGIVLDGAHPHAVWRDKVTDYAGTTS